MLGPVHSDKLTPWAHRANYVVKGADEHLWLAWWVLFCFRPLRVLLSLAL